MLEILSFVKMAKNALDTMKSTYTYLHIVDRKYGCTASYVSTLLFIDGVQITF